MRRTTPHAILAIALITALASLAQSAIILQLRVVEGEGAVYATGSRATGGLTVLVTDETGKPVEGASVSFRLPEDGPSGIFNSGLRSEVATTHADGRAAVWGMQWNKTPGPLEIRITASKDQARAGIVSTQYLSDQFAPKAGGTGTFERSHHGRTKWLLIAGIAAGAGAGVAFSHSSGAKAATAPPTQPLIIGAPSITVAGH
jgi:hypothetical protein